MIHTNLLHFSGCRSFLRIEEKFNLLLVPVINPPERFSGTDRPVDRTGGDAKLLLNIVQKLECVHGLPVHLVDKSKNRNMAHDTDLE